MGHTRWWHFVVGSIGALALTPATAWAATYTVNTSLDNPPIPGECQGLPSDCSLRQAVDAANGNAGADSVSVPGGHYVLTLGPIFITDQVSITGDSARTTLIDGNDAEQVFRGAGGDFGAFGPAFSLSNLTVERGHAQSADAPSFTQDPFAPDYNEGGGIFAQGALTLTNVAVVNNTAANDNNNPNHQQFCGDGGAIAALGGSLTISHSTIANNRTCGDGAIYAQSGNQAGTVLITDSTLTENTSGGRSSALDWFSSHNGSTVTLVNDTIADNSTSAADPTADGALYFAISNNSTSVSFLNTALRNATTSGANCFPGTGSTLTSSGGNFSDDPSGFSYQNTCKLTAATDQTAVSDFKLGTLADNGGQTDTMLPQSGSPLIDAGVNAGCPSDDQRAEPRPAGSACDVGAVEVQPAAPPASQPPPSSPPPSSGPSKSAPSATTGPASLVNSSSATITGTVNPNGQATTYHFEWGTTSAYGHSTASASAGSGTSNQAVSVSLSGLAPHTTYHYRVVASNATGTAMAADRTFKTGSPSFAGAFAPGQRDHMGSAGNVAVRVTCPSGTYVRCAGTLRLSFGGATIGTGSFTLGSGRSATLAVHLTARGQALVRQHKAVAVRGLVRSRDGAGTRRRRSNGGITLLAPTPRRAPARPKFTG